jgi:hypothetical protein
VIKVFLTSIIFEMIFTDLERIYILFLYGKFSVILNCFNGLGVPQFNPIGYFIWLLILSDPKAKLFIEWHLQNPGIKPKDINSLIIKYIYWI